MNQKYNIVIQPAAQKAIEEAYFWLSNYSSQKAITWLQGLHKAILSLENMPFRCSFKILRDAAVTFGQGKTISLSSRFLFQA